MHYKYRSHICFIFQIEIFFNFDFLRSVIVVIWSIL